AVLGEEPLDVLRVLLPLVDLRGPRRDLVLHEFADGVADRELLLREVEVHLADYAVTPGAAWRSRPAAPGSIPRRSAAPWRRGSGARRAARPTRRPRPPTGSRRSPAPSRCPCRRASPSRPLA